MKKVTIHFQPTCDICSETKAKYDAKMRSPLHIWGYLCEECFKKYGLGLGEGVGQELIIEETE